MLEILLLFFIVSAEEPQNLSKDVIVHFAPAQNLSRAQKILDRNQRIHFVFNTLVKHAEVSQESLRRHLQSQKQRFHSFYIENAIVVYDISPKMLMEIEKWPGVLKISPNSEINMKDVSSNSLSLSPQKIESHLTMIHADKVWSQLAVKGRGIVVAGQDTGFYWQHNALRRQYRGYNSGTVSHDYNWHDAIHGSPSGFCSTDEVEPCDDKDHGTHTMGTMIGDDGKGRQIGVAPEAQWIGCRNMKNGKGTVASYLECFEFFLAPYPVGGDPQNQGRPDLAPHIVNNSWSCPVSEGCQGNEFLGVIDAYKAAGILLVAAVSNNGPNCGTASDAPAKYAGEILTVGAYNRYLNDIAFFSALGPSPWKNQVAPNIIAPGDTVVSSVTKGPDSYEDKLGTSMASPQVAGVAALLWSYRPELIGQVDATIDIIQSSATPMKAKTSCPGYPGSQIPNAVFGYGMLNAYQALITP